ncbi:MAG: HAD family hydrolase [Candidatus Eisenbacteria sp.]|nr:HAD family hydrolase [Candidatus Eisenbacteria bacterium]
MPGREQKRPLSEELDDTALRSPQRVRAVIFDLFHTLIDFSAVPAGNSTHALLGVDPGAWTRKIIEESPHHALGTLEDPYESIRMIAHAIDPSIPEGKIRRAVDARPARFRAALLHVRPEVLGGLQQLRQWGLRIGLISNAGLDEVEAWEESPLSPFFDEVLVSCHEGVMKPDPEIYLRCASRLGVTPESCLYVGDGGSDEHRGARDAGMRTVLLLGLLRASYPDHAARRPRNTDWVVDSYVELTDLVKGLRETS